MRAWLMALLLVPLAGCVGGIVEDVEPCPEPEATVLTGPYDLDNEVMWPTTTDLPYLHWATHDAEEPLILDVQPDLGTGGWTAEDLNGPTDPAIEGGTVAFGGKTIQADATPGIRADDGSGRGGLGWTTIAQRPGAEALCSDGAVPAVGIDRDHEPGAAGALDLGIHVWTAGFWTNGTLFYTNMDRVNGMAEAGDIPDGQLGEYAGGEPLPVYIYDESTDEYPQRYQDAGYFVTIQGFNEALKGLQENTATIAYLEPEEAYTAEGREDHDLYGDALIFWIEAVEVVDIPCTYPEPVCDHPAIPEEPPIPPVEPPTMPSFEDVLAAAAATPTQGGR